MVCLFLFFSQCGQELLESYESALGVVAELALVLQSLLHEKPEIVVEETIRNLVVSCFVLSAIQRRDQK